MFVKGFITGFGIASFVLIGTLVVACKITYGNMETFSSMVDVVTTASNNRECSVAVLKEDYILEEAVFKEK